MSLSVFGQTEMSANIADMSDITKIVKIVDQIPTGDDALNEDVVQLRTAQNGYNVGSFYRCSRPSSEASWSDVSRQVDDTSIPKGTNATCSLDLEDGKSQITFTWVNPTNTSLYELERIEIIQITSSDSADIGEVVLFSNCSKVSTCKLTRALTELQFEETSRQFVLRAYFKNGYYSDTTFQKNI